MISGMLGGMSSPSVPPAATTPPRIDGGYPSCASNGTATKLSVAAFATLEPQIDANNALVITTATARALGTRPTNALQNSSRSAPRPVASIKTPVNTKSAIATNS